MCGGATNLMHQSELQWMADTITDLDPMQPVTQTVNITNEEVTQKKYIINVVVKNKLCKTGRLHNAKTPEKVTCQNHPGKCTANISLETVIGEHAFCCHVKHSNH